VRVKVKSPTSGKTGQKWGTRRFKRDPSIRLKDAGQDDAGSHDEAMREIPTLCTIVVDLAGIFLLTCRLANS